MQEPKAKNGAITSNRKLHMDNIISSFILKKDTCITLLFSIETIACKKSNIKGQVKQKDNTFISLCLFKKMPPGAKAYTLPRWFQGVSSG